MRSLSAGVVAALLPAVVGGVVLTTSSVAEAATTPNVFVVRTTVDYNGQPATPPGVANRVFSGSQIIFSGGSSTAVTFVTNRAGVTPRWSFTVPRNSTAGSYPVGGSNPTTIELDGENHYCYTPTGSLVVHSATWSATGDPTSLSVSFAGHCSPTTTQWIYADLMYHSSGVIGAVEGDDPTASTPATAQVGGTPAQVVVPYTDRGTAPVKLGATSIASQDNADHPGWSISNDGCAGVTLAVNASCNVTMQFAPQLSGSAAVLLSTPDGWHAPALRSLQGNATSEPDQPEGFFLSPHVKSLTARWMDPSVSSGSGTVDGYQLVEVANGVAGAVIGTDSPTGYAYHSHLVTVHHVADGGNYNLAVREHFSNGSVGPLSVQRLINIPRRELFFAGQGLYDQSPADGATNTWTQDPSFLQRIVIDPLGTTFAYEKPDTGGGVSVNRVYVAPISAPNSLVTIPDTAGASGATWTSPHTVVYGHSGNDGTYLDAYDTGTQAITAVTGGDALIHPAAMPDGTLVAEPAAGGDLVHLAGGTTTDIPNTNDCTWPTVSVTSRIACIIATTGGNSTIEFVDLDGSNESTVTSLPTGIMQTPNWSMDGQRLDVSVLDTHNQGGTSHIYRVDPAAGTAIQADAPATSIAIAPAELDTPDVRVASADDTAHVVWPTLPATAGIASSVARISTSDMEAVATTDGTGPDTSSASSASFTGLTTGAAYTVTVLYLDGDGNVKMTASRRFLAGVTPMIAVFSGPADGSITGPATAPLVVGSAGDDTDSIHCTIDSVDAACPDGVLPVAGLPAGPHVLGAVAVNAAGSGPAISRSITVDRTAPTVTVPALPLFSLGTSVTVKYSATDSGAGVLSYDVRERRATNTTAFTAYSSPRGFSARSATPLAATSVPAGTTVCFSVRARDKVGNLSAWSRDRCSTILADDRSMTASVGWTRITSSVFYRGTDTRGSRAGAALTTPKLQHGQLALVVTVAPGDGKVNVYDGNKLLKTISLAATRTRYRVVIPIGTATSGYALRVVAVSAARVDIDGWGVFRQ